MLDYSRQTDTAGLSVPKSVTVIGDGGLGAWVTTICALSGVERIVLFAPGKVKGTDLARYPYLDENIGEQRGEVLKKALMNIRATLVMDLHKEFRPELDDRLLQGVVFNCATPSGEFDARVYAATVTAGLRYSSGGYNGLNAGSFPFAIPGLEVPSAPVWVNTLIFSATLMVYSGFVDPVAYWGTISDVAQTPSTVLAKLADNKLHPHPAR